MFKYKAYNCPHQLDGPAARGTVSSRQCAPGMSPAGGWIPALAAQRGNESEEYVMASAWEKVKKNIIPTLASRHLNCDVLCHNGNGVCGFPQKKILSRDKKGHYSEFSLVPLIMHSLIMLGQKDASFCQKKLCN